MAGDHIPAEEGVLLHDGDVLLARAEAELGLAHDELLEEHAARRGHVGREGDVEVPRVHAEDLPLQLELVRRVEWRATREQLVHEHAKRPEVGGGIVPLLLDDLGRHAEECALHREGALLLEQLGDIKVGHAHVALAVE